MKGLVNVQLNNFIRVPFLNLLNCLRLFILTRIFSKRIGVNHYKTGIDKKKQI